MRDRKERTYRERSPAGRFTSATYHRRDRAPDTPEKEKKKTSGAFGFSNNTVYCYGQMGNNTLESIHGQEMRAVKREKEAEATAVIAEALRNIAPPRAPEPLDISEAFKPACKKNWLLWIVTFGMLGSAATIAASTPSVRSVFAAQPNAPQINA